MIYQRIIEDIKQAKMKIEHTITSGAANDYEAYRFYIGRIQGLQDALDICQDCLKGNLNE